MGLLLVEGSSTADGESSIETFNEEADEGRRSSSTCPFMEELLLLPLVEAMLQGSLLECVTTVSQSAFAAFVRCSNNLA